tara:strand:- start:695 stop:985 length:291 start_codon:yes stop_codon:yes gene_type:complete
MIPQDLKSMIFKFRKESMEIDMYKADYKRALKCFTNKYKMEKIMRKDELVFDFEHGDGEIPLQSDFDEIDNLQVIDFVKDYNKVIKRMNDRINNLQ